MKIKALLPLDSEFDLLGQLVDSVAIYKKTSLIQSDGFRTMFLQSGAGPLLKLSVDYEDVVFKFECFNISISLSQFTEDFSGAALIARVENWHSIRCCFRFESERPAQKGEVGSDREQTVRFTGKHNISADSVAACVSMVGIVFWNDLVNVPVAAVVKRPEDTVTLWLYEDSPQILAFMQECEVVDCESAKAAVKAWKASQQAW